jgi:glycerophosphoryl diester phosphodiesterase
MKSLIMLLLFSSLSVSSSSLPQKVLFIANNLIQSNPHAWTEKCNGLIAHGAGGIMEFEVTNSVEALALNYELGHRLFEIDLNLTTDNELAAVHNWHNYGGQKSLADFKKIRKADRFTSMGLDEIYEFMASHKDAYLITDTKSFEYTEEETAAQFRIIHEKAQKYGGDAILNRVIPQIYNERMYDIVTQIYPFRSIIYTLYATSSPPSDVVEFVKDKDDIRAVTMHPLRFTHVFRDSLHEHGKLIFLHTFNELEEVLDYKRQGVHGFYTDFILPKDLESDTP